MNCPGCGGHTSKVLESRIAEAGDAMRRRRECLDCSERFTTYERIEQPVLLVAKHDGRQEPFNASKLMRGLAIACSKRNLPVETLSELVADVEAQLRSGGRKEVASDEVGELALAGLVRIDEAAAIRFASVIERAESLAGFRQVLDRMAAAASGDEVTTFAGQGSAHRTNVTRTDDATGAEGVPARAREAVAV